MSRGKSRSMSGIEEVSSLRKRPEKSSAFHGSTGEGAGRRADAGAAAAPGRQHDAGRGGAADLERDLAGQLQHVAVEEEEAGEVEPADRRQLRLQALLGFGPARVPARA